MNHSPLKIFIYFCFFLFLPVQIFCQDNKDVRFFGPPVEIPLYLAGNFGELRSNHFHAGLDVKTQGVEGLKVLAVADGYVSRIKVSPFGYGLAMYVRHSNGYTSVYAHLQKYNDLITAYVKKHQYANKSYAVELYPKASDFPVKKGDVIAISGNSGGSSAPHLHFEIRETISEAPVNPLQFGFDIRDNIKPFLERLYVYAIKPNSEVNGKQTRISLPFVGGNGSYVASPKYRIETSGDIAFGIKIYDQLNEVYNRCGVREIKLYQNNKIIYHHSMDRVAFNESRYINALADFEEKVRRNNWIVRCFILPNNKLGIYKVKEPGVISIPEGEVHHFRFEVIDFYGNAAIGSFEVKGVKSVSQSTSILTQKPVKHFKYGEVNTFESDEVLVYLPANVLYDDLDFNFWLSDTLPGTFSPVYNIHDKYTPLHAYMALSFKLENFDPALKPKATVVSINGEKGRVSEGGYWKGNYLIVKTRTFGSYVVMVDTIKPKLSLVNVPESRNMNGKWSIIIKAEDNLAGIGEYNAYIDGQWVLTEFDYKNKRLVHYFEDNLTTGKHHFRLSVKDKTNNEAELEFNFVR